MNSRLLRAVTQPWFVFVLSLLILICRRFQNAVDPEFWAEDATIFYREQLLRGPSAIFRAYAGYLHVTSRLIAAFASALPVKLAPTLYSFAAILLAAACCSIFVLKRNRPLLSSDLLRAVLCFIVAASFPATELIGSLTNLQWYLAVAAVPLALTTSAGPAGWEWSLGLLIGLSAPATSVLIPLTIWWIVKHRRPTPFQLGLLVALFIQTLQNRRRAPLGVKHLWPLFEESIRAALVALSNQVFACALFGQSLARDLVARSSGMAGMFLLLGFCILITALLFTADRHMRTRVCGSLWLIVGSLALPCFFREDVRSAFPDFRGQINLGVDRYFFAPSALFAYCVALSICTWKPNWTDTKKAILLITIFSVGTISNFLLDEFPDYHWGGYAGDVAGWKQAYKHGGHHNPVTVPVNPPGWNLDLPGLN